MAKITFSKVRWMQDYDGTWLCIQTPQARAVCDAVNPEKKYDMEVKQHRERRSLDANAYCWLLIGKLADHYDVSPMDVYRQEIRNVGPYEVIPVREDAADRWPFIWGGGGIGFLCDDMGPSKIPGYRNFRCWYGSHVYDTKQMSKLIDAIVQDCKDAGIETLPPDKLESMLEGWT